MSDDREVSAFKQAAGETLIPQIMFCVQLLCEPERATISRLKIQVPPV